MIFMVKCMHLKRNRMSTMAVCHNKLWKLLIDKKMTKTRLCQAAKISTNAMSKLKRDEDVRVEVLIKICKVLCCTIGDIME